VAGRAVQDILATWRDAERLLEALPASSPDRKVLQLAVIRLRTTYRRLTRPGASPPELAPDLVRDTLHETTAVIAAARERQRRRQELTSLPSEAFDVEATG
jgi:hypothetical protein